MKISKDSHLDHGLNQPQIDFLLARFAGRETFFIETVSLPAELGTVPCGLYGPMMGDTPVQETEVEYGVRGERAYKSRLVARPARATDQVTVIAGPHEGEACVLYTAFGGPRAPQEFDDPRLSAENRDMSGKFWDEHALARE